jgi:long-chain acyl-CoA synthetase
MGLNALSSLLVGPVAAAGPAVRSREHGAWYAPPTPFGSDVRALAAALSGYGLSEGARAAVLGSDGCGTLQAGLAVIAAGGTLVPLDPALSDDALRRALLSSGVVQAIATDERQLARILALRPELSTLELVLLISANPSERKPAAMLVATAIEVGAASLAADPGQLRSADDAVETTAACVLFDASGQARMVGRAELNVLADAFAKVLGQAKGKTVLSSLPVGGAERLGVALASLSQGATLLLADPFERPDAGLDTYPADALLIDLTALERLFRAWMEDIDAKSWLGRSATRWALRQGRAAPRGGWKHRLADRIALGGLREKIGGRATSLNVVAHGGRRASDEIESFFPAAGVTLHYLAPDTMTVLAR